MTQNCILIREAGHAIPASVKPLIEAHNRYMSVAFGTGTEVKVVSLASSDKFKVSLESAQGADVKIRDRQVVWLFGNGSETLNIADQQPIPILKDDAGKTVMVAFADGEFDGSFQKVIEEEIKPRVARAYRAAQKDLVKLMEDEMTDPIMGRDIVNTMLGKRGSIVVLSADGVVIRFVTKDDTSPMEGEWGWCSQGGTAVAETQEDPFAAALTSATGVTDETKQAAEPKATGGGLFGKKTSAPTSVTKSGVRPAEGAAPAPADKQVTETESGEETFAEYTIPSELNPDKDGNGASKGKSNFLKKRYIGELPNDWWKGLTRFSVHKSKWNDVIRGDIAAGKKFVKVVTKKIGVAKDFTDMAQQLGHKPTEAPAAKGGSGLFGKGASYPKKVEVAVDPAKLPQPDIKPEQQGPVVNKIKSLISPESIKDMHDLLGKQSKEALDRNSQVILHPELHKEVKAPDFVRHLNHPQVKHIMDTAWDRDIIAAMPRDLLESYAKTWRWFAITTYNEKVALESKANKKAEAEFDAGNTQTTTGVAPAAKSTTGGGLFSKKKVA